MEATTLEWYAVYTRPRWEKKVATLLEEAGYELYCPLNKVTRQWSDRKKTVLEPVFKSYVFVKAQPEKKWDLKEITGVVNFVYWLGKPAVIRESEIATIKRFLNEFNQVEVINQLLEPNKSVRIRQGALMDYNGIVVEISGNKAKVRLQKMGIVLCATIEKKNLELVQPIK